MDTEIVRVDAGRPNAAILTRAGAILRSGGLVAFPTETVYGLGANALDARAVGRIFAAKGRPATNPVIVHVSDELAASELVTRWPETAERLARRFWPGPLTLVLPKHASVPDVVTAGRGTVALRVPAHRVAAELIGRAGVPVAAPSANRSTMLSPTLATHVMRGLSGRIEMILDGGATSGGIESTVVDLSGDVPRILRPGLVTREAIEGEIGRVEVWAGAADAGAAIESEPAEGMMSPGMMSRHYSPRARLEVAAEDGLERVRRYAGEGMRVGWVSFSEADVSGMGDVLVVVMPGDARGYAARLYAELHGLDAEGVERIVVDAVPAGGEWDGIRDRLGRAAAKSEVGG